ncbi:UDP-glucuronosyl/UDP-glucosyltransferase [Artemisia annua]|uniref:UDP-glucuronosyl/UDP-glucosyltransferase n=1 Tax=Artemisia annua TaxID=35608 RepID=A0A2U1L7C7_ARTAN|nr:UDP-glucuronosyl/UDP-glucosyltransferase [Artemisia annua]
MRVVSTEKVDEGKFYAKIKDPQWLERRRKAVNCEKQRKESQDPQLRQQFQVTKQLTKTLKMSTNQVVVVPYPGRGHINPLLNLCHLLTSKLNQHNYHTTIFTVVVTEEWLGFLSQNQVQSNVQFVTIPNVLPSEHNRGSDMITFLAAVKNNMKGPFEDVLDKMEVKVTLIVADATMMWPFEVANERNIPVAAYFPMSGQMFSVMHHVDLLESNNQLYADVSGLVCFLFS